MNYLHRLFYPPTWSIATKISVAMLSIALIPMSFTTYYNLQKSLSSVKASEYRKLELLATSNASRLDQLITDIQRIVLQVSTERSIVNFFTVTKSKAALQASVQTTLDNILHSSHDYDAVYLMNKNGKCILSTDRKFIGQNYAFREYFKQTIQGHHYVSDILVGQTTNRPGLFFANPVRSQTGKIMGVVVLKIKGSDIWNIVNSLRVDSQNYAFLIDENGVIISYPNKSLLYYSLAPLSPQKQLLVKRRYKLNHIESLNLPKLIWAILEAKSIGHTIYYSSLEHSYQIVGFAPLQKEPWVLAVKEPQTQFTIPLNHLIWQNSYSLLLVGGIAAITALLLARNIAKPIRALIKVAQSIEQDDFNFQVLDLRKTLAKFSLTQDDTGQLVRVFLQMVEELRIREQKLKTRVMELHIEIDQSKKARQVAEVTGTEYFQQLHKKAQSLKRRTEKTNESEYFQHLHQKVQMLKNREPTSKK